MATTTAASVLDMSMLEVRDDGSVQVKKKNRFDNLDVSVQHQGSQIILPADPHAMNPDEAIGILQRFKEAENKEFQVVEWLDAFPLDGVVAFYKAMKLKYGLALPVDTPGLFGPKPPQFLSVVTGPKAGDIIQVPYGSFVVPGIEKPIQIQIQWNGDRPMAVVVGMTRKREQAVLLELAQIARTILREDSLYKGRAISLEVDEGGELDLMNPPGFMDLEGVSEADIVFPDTTRDQIEVSLFTPIKQTALCRAHKIPLKRGILLAGPYGTGKTLTARVAASLAEANGWTFVNLNRVEGLAHALKFAARYAPAVIFAEDIDRVVNERDDDANDLVNTIDGIIGKQGEVITVLTTNHIEEIQPVMLRPGRLDAVIAINPPDAKACDSLIRKYAGKLLPANEDLSQVCAELAGQIPATIREVVERSKLGMISRQAGLLAAGDLLVAARGMVEHLTLLNKPRDEETDEQLLARALRSVLGGGGDEIQATLNGIATSVHNTHAVVQSTMKNALAMTQRGLEEIAGKVDETGNKVVARVKAAEKTIIDQVA
jgi:hypothetical protein